MLRCDSQWSVRGYDSGLGFSLGFPYDLRMDRLQVREVVLKGLALSQRGDRP